MSPAAAAGVPGRVLALDVFRGATVALMILVNNPGSWSHVYPPLRHAEWHGLTPTDLVFPWFLFAVGTALALVMRRGDAPARFWPRVARRTLLVFALGVALNASPFVRWSAAGELVWRSLEQLRVMGVLQRIALGFGGAALIVGLAAPAPRERVALAAAALLLLGYWAACLAFGRAGDPYSLEGWFGTALDRALLGPQHLYRGEGVPFDPEGLASTVPAVAQVLLGWWVGEAVARHRDAAGTWHEAGAVHDGRALAAWLLVRALPLLALAWAWQLAMPLNKKIWTSSYVLATTGLAMLLLAALVLMFGLRAHVGATPRWARFLEVFGLNALAIYALSAFVPRLLALARWPQGDATQGRTAWTSPLPWLYERGFAGIADDQRLGSLLFALVQVGAYWMLAAWLARRQIVLRL